MGKEIKPIKQKEPKMIKATTQGEKKTELQFPLLMISEKTGLIIFAIKQTDERITGIVVYDGSAEEDWKPGDYSTEFWGPYFKPFPGKITLENRE